MFSSLHRTLSKTILGRPQKQKQKERRYTLAKYADSDSESVYEARTADTDADLQHPSFIIQKSVTPVPLTLSLRDAPVLREEVVNLFDELERRDSRAKALNALWGWNMDAIEEDGDVEEEENRLQGWQRCMNHFQERLMRFEKHKIREIKMRKDKRTRKGNDPLDSGSVMDFFDEAGQSTLGISSLAGTTTSASSSRSSRSLVPKSISRSAEFESRLSAFVDDGYKKTTRNTGSCVLQRNHGKRNLCMSEETVDRTEAIATRTKIVDGDWEMTEHVGDSDDRGLMEMVGDEASERQHCKRAAGDISMGEGEDHPWRTLSEYGENKAPDPVASSANEKTG
ncbi:hypothetical protein BCR34DRAFT_585051 [Clohesyomyces aquaticus]|uniref:Uncharacterized protein n=1 Tax=Clohesyomyces aquaticus TaxID=1231657 RepID=A0A1Y1ZYT1_9PLEO|nr:hypothetical protein BCR34DRAFT_585051 [Clohesyomyces aquaticus]